jgi:hypothetical protein
MMAAREHILIKEAEEEASLPLVVTLPTTPMLVLAAVAAPFP